MLSAWIQSGLRCREHWLDRSADGAHHRPGKSDTPWMLGPFILYPDFADRLNCRSSALRAGFVVADRYVYWPRSSAVRAPIRSWVRSYLNYASNPSGDLYGHRHRRPVPRTARVHVGVGHGPEAGRQHLRRCVGIRPCAREFRRMVDEFGFGAVNASVRENPGRARRGCKLLKEMAAERA